MVLDRTTIVNDLNDFTFLPLVKGMLPYEQLWFTQFLSTIINMSSSLIKSLNLKLSNFAKVRKFFYLEQKKKCTFSEFKEFLIIFFNYKTIIQFSSFQI